MRTTITIDSSVPEIHTKLIQDIIKLAESYNLTHYNATDSDPVIIAENTQEITLPSIYEGFYLLDYRYQPTGSNRVDFMIRMNQININNSGFRDATVDEINNLLESQKNTLRQIYSK